MADAAVQMVLEKYLALAPVLDERAKRLWAAAEARSLGRGGIARVAEATGMSRRRIHAGLRELREAGPGGVEATGRQRAPGAGRKRAEDKDPGLLGALRRLVDPATRGDPGGPLPWTSLSAAHLAAELGKQGHAASERTVNRLLHDLGYGLRSNRKAVEGRQHPDRDRQFNHLNRKAARFQRRGDPVVSVDTKKKELVGDFANGGREWRPKGDPEKVRMHDFGDPALGKAIPYGVYDVAANNGWVGVGVDHDTATLRRWWERMGRGTYDEEMASVRIRRRRFHGEWNYMVRPNPKPHNEPLIYAIFHIPLFTLQITLIQQIGILLQQFEILIHQFTPLFER